MMMLWTQISKKKNNLACRFLVAVLGIALLATTGCAKQDTTEVKEEKQEEVTIKETVDYSGFLEHKVSLPSGSGIYHFEGDQLVKCGTAQHQMEVDLSGDLHDEYLRIQDSDLYVWGKDLQQSDRWYNHNTNLLPLGTLETANQATLYNFNHETCFSMDSPTRFTYYVKPNTNETTYGILFGGDMYYVEANDVTHVEETPVEGAHTVPVLMYHFFYDESVGERRKDANDLEVKELDAQLSYLQENNYVTLTMQEVLFFLEGRASIPIKSVAITIDDGDPSVHQYAYPIFTKYNAKATLFLICGWEDPTMSYDFWEMREAGLELQSHSFLMHQGGCEGMGHGGRILCVDHETGVQDTKQSLDYVDGGFVYCYPFGDYNDNAISIIKDAGVKMAFTTEPGMVQPGMNVYTLPRVRVRGGDGLNAFINSIQHN